jgi:hypothetical protein
MEEKLINKVCNLKSVIRIKYRNIIWTFKGLVDLITHHNEKKWCKNVGFSADYLAVETCLTEGWNLRGEEQWRTEGVVWGV